VRSLWSQVRRLKGIPSVYLREGWDKDAQRVLPEAFLPRNLFSENPVLRLYVESFHRLMDTTVHELKRARNTETLKDLSYSLPRFLTVGDVDGGMDYIEELGRFPSGTRETIHKLLGRMAEEYPKVRETDILVEAKLDNPCILIRLLAAGLYSGDKLMLRQVSEVFDAKRLQVLTRKEDKAGMDKSIHFLYLGLADKRLGGFQGNRRAGKQILDVLEERYSSDDYMMNCVKELRKYF
jgi:hypothetical protein